MDPKKHSSFQMYLTDIGQESKLESSQVQQIIENYIDDMEAVNPVDSSERVKIKRTKQGEIIIATSLKIPNLRFRMGELLFRMVGKGISIAGAKGELWKTSFFIISFLRDVCELASRQLIAQDAQVLVAIYALTNTENHKQIRVDQVVEYLQKELTREQVSSSLAELEKIWCIEVNDQDGITLIESVVIQSI